MNVVTHETKSRPGPNLILFVSPMTQASFVIAERLSGRLMIVHSALAMGIYIYIYIYISVTLLRMCRDVRIPTVRSMGMNEFLRVCIMIFPS